MSQLTEVDIKNIVDFVKYHYTTYGNGPIDVNYLQSYGPNDVLDNFKQVYCDDYTDKINWVKTMYVDLVGGKRAKKRSKKSKSPKSKHGSHHQRRDSRKRHDKHHQHHYIKQNCRLCNKYCHSLNKSLLCTSCIKHNKCYFK